MTADVLAIADAARRRRQAQIRKAIAAQRRLWGYVDPNRIRASWASGPAGALTKLVTAAQATSAAAAEAEVEAMLAAQGIAGDIAWNIIPTAFAGVASDGRSLESLFDYAPRVALHQVSTGLQPSAALQVGGRWLDQALQLQLADAHRAATSVATATHRAVGGFTRVASSPCCSRCALLSGRWYRYDAAFHRHPRCHCSQIPSRRDALVDDERVITADRYFESLSPTMQDRVFTKAGAQAIREGADIGQVVNARRGMETATSAGRRLQITRSGGPRRGVRLMPEEIFRQASSRDEALRLLAQNGYLGSIARRAAA